MELFKIWNVNRTKKVCVVISSDQENKCEQLIFKANQKLEINGSVLVLESDGTLVDDDNALMCLKKEIFLLLQCNEFWSPVSPPPSKTSSFASVSSYASEPIDLILGDETFATNTPLSNIESLELDVTIRKKINKRNKRYATALVKKDSIDIYF
ncbi:hypothetical protein FQR65_LT15737 [Abscondita terminalis]|nr:hypothetical protein FQR65_LT15737 [Abscondita terminalis]